MARARSPDSIEAEKLYHEGMKLVDIAKKLGVPDSTVRRWKSTQNWDEEDGQGRKKQSERSEKAKANARKPRGAPKGNQNAAGHAPSVPKRNKNAEKYGARSAVYLDALDEDEKVIMQDVLQGEAGLMEQIGVYTVRERKLMHKIREFEASVSKGLYMKGVKTVKHSGYDESGNPVPESIDTYTETEHWIKGLTALEAELTKVQRAKTKCMDSLIRLKQINENYDNLLEIRRAAAEPAEDSGDEEVRIYIPDNGRGGKG